MFNRGVDKREIFLDDKDFVRFIRSMREFNNNSTDAQRDFEKRKMNENNTKLSFGYPKLSFMKMPKLVDIICYCLNPNHFHFLLKQLEENGIEKFLHKLSLGYTKYFNYKNRRTGSLFQGTYKAIKVSNYSHWLKLIVYVNCNSEVHQICPADDWPWSSFLDYIGKRNGSICNQEIILEEFTNKAEFRNFCYQVLPGIIEIKQYLLE